MCQKSLVTTMTMTFLGKSVSFTFHCILSLVLLLQLCIKENAAFLVLFVDVIYTWSLCHSQALYRRMGVPFLSLQYSHRLNQQQGSQSKIVSHCWRASQSHWCLQDWPLCCADNRPITVQSAVPNREGKAYVQMVLIFTSDLNIRHLQEQPVMPKEKWVFHSSCSAKWILRKH